MTSIRVLHVDDDPDIRAVIEISLALDPEIELRSCASGNEALSAASEWSPDLILLDVMMPDMDGPAALALLQKQPQTAGIPVVFVTAVTQLEEASLLSIGAAAVIKTPFDTVTLPARLHAIVGQLHQRKHTVIKQAEQKRNLLAAIVESSDDAIIAKTLEGQIIAWNAGAERMFGYSAAAALGQNISLLIPEHLRNEEDYIVGQLRRGNNIGHFESVRRHASGRNIHISLSVSPIRDNTGRIVGASKVVRDIGERKSMEAALQASAQRNELALLGMSVGLWDWNIVTNAIYWSPRFLEVLGEQDSNLVPNYDEFVSRLHPEDQQRTVLILQRHVNKEGPYDVEYRLRKHDGEYVWLHAIGQATWDDSGIPQRMVGAIVDLTERKEVELRSEVRTRKAREQSALIEQTLDAVLVWDWKGPITLWNKSAEKLYGFSQDEAVGRISHELLQTRLPGGLNKFVAILEAASSWEGELEHITRDGEVIVVDSRMTLVRDGGRAFVIEVNRDMSERRRAQDLLRETNLELEARVSLRTAELRAANADVENFAYAASHDLKAPLRVIDNAAKWLEEDLHEHLTGENRENMTLMRSRIKRMEKLLDDLLEYSRIGRTTDKQYFETVTGTALMDNILSLIAPPPGFTVRVSPIFAEVQVRRMPLQQILMNLIGNAIKHHDRSEGHIEVTLEDCGPHYAFAVKDDGPGIPAQFHAQVFRLFETLKPRDQVEGSGMGLAMVRKNIEVCGGKLDLESSEGNGSSFRFTWPKQQIDSEAA